MVKKINHIGIAVKSIEDATPLYRDVYGMQAEGVEVVAEQKVKVAFFAIGESRIELLEPTSADSPVAKFIEKNGAGVHHIAYEVEDVVAEIARLKSEGVRLIDEVPRCGAHHTQIAFLHPKSSGGVLTEMCQVAH
ncbi:MAG: methylmalonyl-CoA epimerase [Desulfobacteraceae bacterium 4572_35.1]|nr:MAG: methylmalonyl-CoA epimerase [Desulfobacteraceae bacterium 4572_35.1]